jgi:hypothetical protein
MMRSYQPSGKVPLLGALGFIVFGLVFALATGVIAYLISTQIYLLIVSPFLLAVVSGGIAYLGVRWGKIRNTVFSALIGLLLGNVVIGAYWGATYVDALNQVADARTSKNSDDFIGRLTEAQPTLSRTLREETGQTGIVGLILLLAEDGMTFTRTSSPDSTGVTLDRNMTLIYWAIEALLVVGAGIISAIRSARVPFCEISKRWFTDKDYQPLGTIDVRTSNQFTQALRSGDFRTAGQMLTLGAGSDIMQVKVVKCGAADLNTPGDLVLRVTRQAGNRSNDVLVGLLTPMEYRALVDSAQRRPAV